MVKGWLYEGAPEAIVLLSQEQNKAKVPGGVAEIGVHHGKLFILLYLLGPDDQPAVAIDIFSQQHLNIDSSGAGDLAIFKRNLTRHADTRRLVVHEGDSTLLTSEFLRGLGRGPFRMISIDGGHTAEITASDLATSEGALTQGGVIILDDCFKQEWPGVIDGVHRHFSQPRAVVPFGIGANKTFFCHPEFAARYMDVLRRLEGKAIEQEFLGHPVVCFEYAPMTLARWYRRVDPWRAIRNAYHGALSGR
jgi:Methyltransferase domain